MILDKVIQNSVKTFAKLILMKEYHSISPFTVYVELLSLTKTRKFTKITAF